MFKPIHGKTGHVLYGVWLDMKKRCYGSGDRWFHRYGGRGIKVCDEWVSDFPAFLSWAEQAGWFEGCGLSIDRIDNDGDYSPANCRWATNKQQSRNKSTNTVVTDKHGNSMCLKEAVERFGAVKYNTVIKRLAYGWECWRAITTPASAKPQEQS